MLRPLAVSLALGLMSLIPAAQAGPVSGDSAQRLGGTGLPLPRFASLGSNKVHMREGPSELNKISWQYQREGMPVEIIEEFGPWRKVRDIDNSEGWINGNLLSGQRHGVVVGSVRNFYTQPDTNAKVAWRAEPGVVGRLVMCEDAWCQINVEGKSGWVLREQIWGTYENENFN
jgi:SH3-like domain-containing protein